MGVHLILTSLIAVLLGLSGCATAPRSVSQEVEVEAVSTTGAVAMDARCTLHQGSVETSVTPARRVTLITGGQDLVVRCHSDMAQGEARVPASIQGSRTKGALIGAGVGALIGLAAGNSGGDSGYVGGVQGMVTFVGSLAGAAIGALAGAPTYDYPTKVRVVLEPASATTVKP